MVSSYNTVPVIFFRIMFSYFRYRKEEDTAEEVESSTDWEVENLTLGAEGNFSKK